MGRYPVQARLESTTYQAIEAGYGILPVLLLGAATPCVDNQYPVSIDPLAGIL